MTGEELKKLRNRYGLTQAKAAALAMVTERHWQHWEAGTRTIAPVRVKVLKAALKNMKPIIREE